MAWCWRAHMCPDGFVFVSPGPFGGYNNHKQFFLPSAKWWIWLNMSDKRLWKRFTLRVSHHHSEARTHLNLNTNNKDCQWRECFFEQMTTSIVIRRHIHPAEAQYSLIKWHSWEISISSECKQIYLFTFKIFRVFCALRPHIDSNAGAEKNSNLIISYFGPSQYFCFQLSVIRQRINSYRE